MMAWMAKCLKFLSANKAVVFLKIRVVVGLCNIIQPVCHSHHVPCLYIKYKPS